MKMRLLLTIVGLTIGLAVPALAQENNTVDPEVRQQIEASIVKFDEAYNKNDPAAVAALYTQDAVEAWGWEKSLNTVSGRKAIERRYALHLPIPGKFSSNLVQVYAIGDDICAISEFYRVYLKRKGYAVKIYAREGDTRKIRMEYAN
jgi:ketosteroid isomerase-like protein